MASTSASASSLGSPPLTGAAPPSETASAPEPTRLDGSVPPDKSAAGTTEPPRQPPTSTRRRGGLSPFQSRPYRYLFAGSALTMTGFFMQQVAQGWLIYDLTASATWLGVISFAGGIPMLVLSLPAGVIVDRFDRRTSLIVAQALTAVLSVLLAALIWTGLVQPWHVAAIAFASGCCLVVMVPARQALLPSTIERPQMGAAIALMSTGVNSGRVFGPGLAGVLIAALGAAAAFVAQAVGFVLALVCAWMLAPQRSAAQARQRSPLQNLLEGLRYVWDDPTVFALMCLQAIPAFLLMPYSQLMPIFARDILDTGPDGLGTMMMALGVGSVAGSIGIVVVPQQRHGMMLFVAAAGFGAALALFAISTSLWLSIAIMGLVGVTQAVYLAMNNTLVQMATPDHLQGRVMSVYMMTWGLMPLGSLPQGMLADWLGAPLVLGVTGLLACVAIGILAVRFPSLRAM